MCKNDYIYLIFLVTKPVMKKSNLVIFVCLIQIISVLALMIVDKVFNSQYGSTITMIYFYSCLNRFLNGDKVKTGNVSGDVISTNVEASSDNSQKKDRQNVINRKSSPDWGVSVQRIFLALLATAFFAGIGTFCTLFIQPLLLEHITANMYVIPVLWTFYLFVQSCAFTVGYLCIVFFGLLIQWQVQRR